jgi:two-component system phosphate regulon sensor histidine kinase PhoR
VGNWDRRRLTRLLGNLLDNAVKYSPLGGEVRVQVGRRAGQALLSVEDQGVGIPEEDLIRIFERFQRGHNVATGQIAGTGIGLASVRHIVESHGGSVSAVNAPSGGAIFCVQLPLE